MAKSKKLVTSLAALAVSAAAISPAITADAAAVNPVVLKAKSFRGGVVELPTMYGNSRIVWDRSTIDWNQINKFQTVYGVVGSQERPIQMQINLLNYPIFAEKAEPQVIKLGEKPVLPERLNIKFVDKFYPNAIKWEEAPVADKEGTFFVKGTYTKDGRTVVTSALYTVEGVEDKEAPELKYEGPGVYDIENGAKFELPTVKAMDNVDEEIEVTHVIKDASGKELDAIDTKVAGKYTITFMAEDKAGNKAKPVEIQVMVAEALPKVESVKAINTKALEVALNTELDNLDGLTFSVKRGETSVVLTPELSKDKKSVSLSSSTNLVAGEYTVTVTGGKFADGTNSATVKVAAQKIDKIEFNGDVLAKTGTGTATVGFKVYDQYGTDITGSATSLINNINWSANVAVDSLNDANGVLAIDLAGASDFAANQTILITAVDSVTGTSKAVNFTVGAMPAVKTLELGEVVLPKDTVRVYTGAASAATFEVIAKDQYGNDLDKASKLNGVTVLSSDAAVVPTLVDVDGKPVVNLDTTALTTSKSVTFTLVINATGETVTKTVQIAKPAQADVVTLGTLETNVVAAGDVSNEFVLPITVVNQFGETMTAKQIAAAGLSITGTGSFASSSLQIETDSSNENYGKIVNKAAIGAAGVGTIVVTSPTGKTASANYEVKAARKVVEVVAPKKITSNLVSGATTAVAYQFKDQYGDVVTASDNTDLKWKVSVKDLTGDAGVITANRTTGTDESLLNPVTVSATAGKAGTAKVTVQLLNASDEVVSQYENTFTVVANNAEGLTYSVSDVPTLYSHATVDTALDGTSAYAAALSFTAKDANGNEFAIPASQILSVESVKGYLDVATLGSAIIDAQDDSIVVGAKDATEIGAAAFGTGNTVTDTVKVAVNTASGIKVITKDVTISKEAPKALEMKIVDKGISAANPYALQSGTKDVTALTFATRADAISLVDGGIGDSAQNNVFVVTKDQYGVYNTVAKDFILNSVNLLAFGTGDKFSTTAAGKFTLTDVNGDTQYAAGTNITLSVLEGNLTDTLTVKINAETPPTVMTALGDGLADGESIASAGTDTVVFSESLNAASKTVVENALKAAVGGVASSDLGFAWVGATLTVTNNHASVAATFAADVTVNVADVYGNKATGLVIVTQ